MKESDSDKTELAFFGGGCFWCIEAVFDRIEGVRSVMPGYAGGTTEKPTYEDVCTGMSGHAEVVQITYDPAVISYEELLEVFWKAHDPTTLNRQGADIGTQYRSVIFYSNQGEKETAERSKQNMETSGTYSAPIVTVIEPLESFYPAEEYHRDYYNRNPGAGYCRVIIRPKLKKMGLK